MDGSNEKVDRPPGVAFIKEQYICPLVNIPTEETPKNDSEDRDTSEPPTKRQKHNGRNYNRPKFVKERKENKLCRSFWCVTPGQTDTEGLCSFPNCQFSHDVKGYIENKLPDLKGNCHNYDTYGFCSYGVTCRYGGNHIESFGSKRNEEGYQKYLEKPPFINVLQKEVQFKLRKKKYDFTAASQALEKCQKVIEERKNRFEKKSSTCEVSSENGHSSPVKERIGPASDTDLVRLRSTEKKKINWENKTYLAPLTTVGNLPFRRVCKKYGADITCGEMAVSRCLLQGSPSEWALVKKHSSEDCFGVQLCSNNEAMMVKCAQLLEDQIEMDFVDINMGCPIDLIYTEGAGSALMRRPSTVEKMVRGMTEILSVPVTLKMRTGIYQKTNVAHEIIEKAKLWDVSLVTIHGRSKEQRYCKAPNWEYVYSCAEMASPMPLFGSGDVLTYEDYNYHKKHSKLAGLMVGRGALIKPWIFTEIKEQRHWDISSSERFDILKEFVHGGLEHWGSDSEGIEKTRRFLLEWLSFLHRYIPVGLLDRIQEMNQRPVVYFGRDDLETMMASNNVKEWLQISEMLLGKVPDNFQFLPKHKANSWN